MPTALSAFSAPHEHNPPISTPVRSLRPIIFRPQILAYEQEQIEIHESRQKRAIELRQIKENEKKLKQQRIIMEKYLGVKPKRKAAVDPLNAEGAAGEEDAGEVDSELDGRGATLRTAKIPAGLKGLEPRIETLVIAGELKHGRSVTAQGFLENCRCVRFQWATSSDGKRFTRVPGATMPTFFLTFGDLGHFVEVEATPVADDGFEGRPLKARAGPIATAKEMAAEVKRNVQEAKRNAFLFEEGVFVGGARAILRLRNFDVSLTSPSKMEVGAITLGGTIVVASRNDVHALEARALRSSLPCPGPGGLSSPAKKPSVSSRPLTRASVSVSIPCRSAIRADPRSSWTSRTDTPVTWPP